MLWEWLKIQLIFHRGSWQLMYGVYRLFSLKGPRISVLGGRCAQAEGEYARLASTFSFLCVRKGYAILTGGGAGIMEAANCGASQALADKKDRNKKTIGIGLKGIDSGYVNPCADVVMVNTYFVREWLLLRYSSGFVVFPGGLGTVDEFFSLINLIKLKKLPPCPIVLVDKKYWEDIFNWCKKGFEKRFIVEDIDYYFTVADSAEEAYEIISKHVSL